MYEGECLLYVMLIGLNLIHFQMGFRDVLELEKGKLNVIPGTRSFERSSVARYSKISFLLITTIFLGEGGFRKIAESEY
jgi:hypothetical protein